MSKDKPVAKGESRNPLFQHPAGSAAGGIVGAAAAAAVAGSMAGPVGTVAGAVIGAAAGALTGSAFSDLVDPEAEVAFWRSEWQKDPQRAAQGMSYEQDFSPAYRYGVDAFTADPDRHFDELEPRLSQGWMQARGESRLEWGDARLASMDAWQRARDLANRKPD